MAREVKRSTWGDWFRWYGIVFGGMLVLVSVLPLVPWRYSRTDTNIGNRFVMDRFYSLWGATNQFGKTVGWGTLQRTMRHKNEEFGKASPLSALVGTVGQQLGAGGAAVGCAMWSACKEHVNHRYASYYGVFMASTICCIVIVLGVLACIVTVMYSGAEDQKASKNSKKNKKHKKHKNVYDDDWSCRDLSSQAKTMIFSIISFVFCFGGTSGFNVYMDMTLKDLQTTAYYPYAASHLGPYLSLVGSIFIFVSMMISINRVSPICGKKSEEDEAMTGPPQYAGGYGKGPWAKGGKGMYAKGGYGYGEGWGEQPSQYYGGQGWGEQPSQYAAPAMQKGGEAPGMQKGGEASYGAQKGGEASMLGPPNFAGGQSVSW